MKPVKTGVRIEIIIVHLTTQSGPWILRFPDYYPGIPIPGMSTETFDKSPILIVIYQLCFKSKISHICRSAICINVLSVSKIFMVLPDRIYLSGGILRNYHVLFRYKTFQ